MDNFEITHDTTTVSRSRSLTDMLTILERGLGSIRAEMQLGMQVDEKLVSELESRVRRLQQMAAVKPTPSNKQ